MIKGVIFTREHPLDSLDKQRLLEHGFEVYHLPLITCQPNPLPLEVSQQVKQADWVFFTSAVAVEFFKPYLSARTLKIASIGPQTTLAIRAAGLTVDFEAKSHYAVDFVKDWLSENPGRAEVLLPQSSLSNPIMAEQLVAAGHGVTAWAMYDTQPNHQGQAQLVDVLKQDNLLWTFASPSAFASFQAIVKTLPVSHRTAVIGTTTAKALADAGYPIHLMPEEPSIKQMIEAIIQTGGDLS